MPERPHALITYDTDGNIIAVCDFAVFRDEEGRPVVADFAGHEAAGLPLRDYKDSSTVRAPLEVLIEAFPDMDPEELRRNPPPLPKDHPYRVARERIGGMATWPEWLSLPDLWELRVELDKRHKHPLRRLTHKRSGHVRDRQDVENAIATRLDDEAKAARREGREPGGVNITDITGGPGKPLELGRDGRTKARRQGKRLTGF